MQINLVSIDEVKPYEGNPRQNDQAVDAVAASLREFGFRQPIVVDGNGVIIAQSRVLACSGTATPEGGISGQTSAPCTSNP